MCDFDCIVTHNALIFLSYCSTELRKFNHDEAQSRIIIQASSYVLNESVNWCKHAQRVRTIEMIHKRSDCLRCRKQSEQVYVLALPATNLSSIMNSNFPFFCTAPEHSLLPEKPEYITENNMNLFPRSCFSHGAKSTVLVSGLCSAFVSSRRLTTLIRMTSSH